MTREEIIDWGLEVPKWYVQRRRPKRNGIHRLLEQSSTINRRRCRVCTGALGENPECSYCEHKRDELGWGV